MNKAFFSGIVVFIAITFFATAGAVEVDAPSWSQLMVGTTKALRANDVPQAIRFCESALDMAEQFNTNDCRLSQTQVLRAEVYLWQKRNDLAEKMFKRAVNTCERAAGSNSTAVINPLSSLANFYHFVARHPERSALLLERIRQIVESDPNAAPRDRIMWNRNLGILYQQMGEFAKGEPLFKRAVALSENDSDWYPHELLNAADFYRAWRRYDRAEVLANDALTLRDSLLKTDGTNIDIKLSVAVCLNSLGAIYLADGSYQKAEEAYRRSFELTQSFMQTDQSDLRPQMLGLAEALQAQRKYDAAAPLFARALANAERNLGPADPDMADILKEYAESLKSRGKTREAEEMLARAEKIRRFASKKG